MCFKDDKNLDPLRTMIFSVPQGPGGGLSVFGCICINLGPWIRSRIQNYKMKGKEEFDQRKYFIYFEGIFFLYLKFNFIY